MTRRPIDALKRYGFRKAGEFVLVNGIIRLDGDLPLVPGVYAHVVDGWAVNYVGSSDNVRNRVRGYGFDLNITYSRDHRPVREGIRDALQAGSRVEVWIKTDVEYTTPQGLSFFGHEGIETALIKQLDPVWNVLGCKPRSAWAGTDNTGALKSWATRRARIAA